MKLHRLFIFIFLAVLAGTASGMGLAEYQKAVEEAHGHAYVIIAEINDGGEGDEEGARRRGQRGGVGEVGHGPSE